ncbi:PREDICTED: trypsin-4-like [Ceratosolen solmsi marchali]|uniref:Trypsin-4-like n=1 Tax=Ceratosolen solmsi marchali TaxID=326594 RepID=A0AAJ6YSL5_9HYME|nr:PREDICTED: trypsin-4-like [Ceratosolen solmsi marchali]
MRAKVHILISYCIILGSQYDYISTKPMIGRNVQIAAENEYPFIVSIIRISQHNTNSVLHCCTGSLITRKDIATVEHCLENEQEDSMRVVVGAVDYRQGVRFPIQWWITYDVWAIFNGIAIDFEVNDVANIRSAEMVGWGLDNGTVINPVLKKATVRVLTNRDCVAIVSRLASRTVALDKRQALCGAAHPYVIMTLGDNGGPLVYKNKLIGITKGTVPASIPVTDPNLINLYMSIEYYKRFFYSNMDIANI